MTDPAAPAPDVEAFALALRTVRAEDQAARRSRLSRFGVIAAVVVVLVGAVALGIHEKHKNDCEAAHAAQDLTDSLARDPNSVISQVDDFSRLAGTEPMAGREVHCSW